MLEDVGDLADFPIPLPNVTGPILQKVIEWCTHHRNDGGAASGGGAGASSSAAAAAATGAAGNSASSSSSSQPAAQPPAATTTTTAAEDIDEWDQEFCKVDQGTLFELILAANYLDIKPLLDLTCKTVANMIKGLSCLFYFCIGGGLRCLRVCCAQSPTPMRTCVCIRR